MKESIKLLGQVAAIERKVTGLQRTVERLERILNLTSEDPLKSLFEQASIARGRRELASNVRPEPARMKDEQRRCYDQNQTYQKAYSLRKEQAYEKKKRPADAWKTDFPLHREGILLNLLPQLTASDRLPVYKRYLAETFLSGPVVPNDLRHEDAH